MLIACSFYYTESRQFERFAILCDIFAEIVDLIGEGHVVAFVPCFFPAGEVVAVLFDHVEIALAEAVPRGVFIEFYAEILEPSVACVLGEPVHHRTCAVVVGEASFRARFLGKQVEVAVLVDQLADLVVVVDESAADEEKARLVDS